MRHDGLNNNVGIFDNRLRNCSPCAKSAAFYPFWLAALPPILANKKMTLLASTETAFKLCVAATVLYRIV